MTNHPAPGPHFELLVLVASAGGLEAMAPLLAELAPQPSVAVVIGQHLGTGSTLPTILRRMTRLDVQWVQAARMPRRGHVYVAPPHQCTQLLAGRGFALADIPAERRSALLVERPLDALLSSIAAACGARTLAVVLTGSGHDGAQGALAVRQAGGLVLVQQPDTASFPEMPRAAIDAGAATGVLPLAQLGREVARLLAARTGSAGGRAQRDP